MREAEFKDWITRLGYDQGTVGTQLARAKRLDQAYGDLDTHFDRDKFAGITASLTYSAEDKRNDAANPSRLPIEGDLYSNLASYRATLNYYQRFRDDEQTGRPPRPPELGGNGFAEEVSRMMQVFKERMPDFTSFAAEDGRFWEDEGEYKREARANVIAAISDTAKSDEQSGRDVCKVLGQGTRQGLPLSWRTLGEVGKAPHEAQRWFFETVASLARLSAGDRDGLLRCARELESLRETIPGLRRGEVLGIAISVYGTVNVNDACWYKARTFDRLGNALLGKKLFASPRFEIADFEQFQWMMNRIRDQLDDWNWQTGSLTDVQGFIWVAMAEDWAETQAADLSREAVEMAMDECQETGVSAFLAKYQFGKARDYWVRRENDLTLYPAKATAGAAYGFMPGGKPQSAKEFYGGFGEQAANGILQRLGFEVVSEKGGGVAEPDKPQLSPVPPPTNLILYGPPGTGKTWTTAAEAVRLCDGTGPTNREALMARYRELVEARRIDFVTFHQSYSYEEFVEGLRPQQGEAESEGASDGGAGFSLVPEEGVFRRIAHRAGASRGGGGQFAIGERQIFKLSIGEAANPVDDYLFEEAVAQGHILLGYDDIDWSDARFADRDAMIAACRAYDGEHPENDRPDATPQTGRIQCPMIFRNWMKRGDLVIVSKGNSRFRAIGEVTGDYEYAPRESGVYPHRRKVNWLWVDKAGQPVEDIYAKRFSMRSAYQLTPADLNIRALESYINSQIPGAIAAGPEPYVLIIDEINRGNISKIFGELITLIEPDKRAGMANALEVRLPYSKEPFSVPANLHIIGTMNTADRSIALLDTALRRRFVFREVAPDTNVSAFQNAVRETGLPLDAVLNKINDRIEYLVDREHRIGHAFFIGCDSRADVDAVMRDKIIPLLQEYFFEDWSRVAAVLGERPGKGGAFLDCRKLKDPTGQGGEERESWSVRLDEEGQPDFASDAYERLIGKMPVQLPGTEPDETLDEAAE